MTCTALKIRKQWNLIRVRKIRISWHPFKLKDVRWKRITWHCREIIMNTSAYWHTYRRPHVKIRNPNIVSLSVFWSYNIFSHQRMNEQTPHLLFFEPLKRFLNLFSYNNNPLIAKILTPHCTIKVAHCGHKSSH